MSSHGLRTISCCTYLTNVEGTWRDEDWMASKGVKLLKGDRINGYFEINLAGTLTRITNENATVWTERAVPKRMAQYLKEAFPPPATLVPVPNSTTTRQNRADFKILSLATAIVKAAGAGYDVCAALVFDNEQVSSRKGGPRSPYHFEQAYELVSRPSRGVILLDDVLTSGGHLVGAAWKLQSEGVRVVGALTFGRSTRDQIDPVFAMHEEVLSLAKIRPNF